MKKLLLLGTLAAVAAVVYKKVKASSETKVTWQKVTDTVS
ncbi:DLW-39 family protein [Glutamicibacter sp. PS]|nr:DLW-39 family protein [Glutamicibacter sp. PS]MDR4534909.1 DLW-39 family protein [Glutamicibacter sp. PS]